MKKYSTFSTFIALPFFFVFVLFHAGCDSKESTGSTDNNQTATKPATPQVTVNGPNTTSTDPYATTAKTYAQMFTNISTQFAPLQNVPGNTNGNIWTYEMTVQGITTKYQCVKNSDGSVLWTITWNGTSGSKTYTNWKVYEAYSTADGKNGYWRVYEENDTVRAGEYTWSTASNGTVTGTISSFTNGVEDERAVFTSNTDGSGELNVYMKVTGVANLVLKTKITWLSNGSGTWTTYKNDGTVEATGSWT